MKGMSLGFKEAQRLAMEGVKPLPAEDVSLVEGIDRVAASDIYALVDSPSIDSSRKDGYAVLSHEVADATTEKSVRVRLLGSMAAGGEEDIRLKPGTAVRVLTGARVPAGADAVVAEEFARTVGCDVLIASFASSKNILARGSDVAMGECIIRAGEQILPTMAGLLAAAGHGLVSVFRNPVVGLIGVGDEIVEPGQPSMKGKLYASNIMTLAGWCSRYKMNTRLAVAKDDHEALADAIKVMSEQTDVTITSGGAWTGDHDIVAQTLKELGWREVFHRIRLGPGKAVGFGMLDDKPVFILAGGPTSNLVGFLQIALPGILTLAGHSNPVLPTINARLISTLKGSELDWTDFFFGVLETADDGLPNFHPMEKRCPLTSLARAAALAQIPEGQECLPEGSAVPVQLLK